MKSKRVKEELVMIFGQDEERSLVIAMRRHVDSCPHCHEKAEHTRRIVAMIRRRCERTRAPKELKTRIVAGLRRASPSH
ncbi:MAG: hypothetical protein AAGC60_22495 [Acidobacteriota bacterium]